MILVSKIIGIIKIEHLVVFWNFGRMLRWNKRFLEK